MMKNYCFTLKQIIMFILNPFQVGKMENNKTKHSYMWNMTRKGFDAF